MMETPIRPDESRMVDYMERYRGIILKLTPPGCGYVAHVTVDCDVNIGCVRPQTPLHSQTEEKR